MRDAILKRISTRTFTKETLAKNQIKEIKQLLAKYANIQGPFGNSFEFTFDLNEDESKKGQKIGTYGLIKNVPAFIGGIAKNNRESLIDFGYVFEMIILELTKLDYATCWLGGTFKRKDYRRGLNKDEVIPAISPIGFRAEKRSIVDRTLRSAAQSHKRLPFGELFHYFDTNQELEEAKDSRFVDIMQLVRKAPSASNKQPWRIFVTKDHDAVHVYLKRNKLYGSALSYDIQLLDIGISLAHLEVGLNHYDFSYDTSVLEEGVFFDGLEYVMSYTKHK